MSEIRPITPEDIPQIVRLVDEAGFPARSPAGWIWAFFDNPDQGTLAPGLVAESDGKLVAMIGTQARRFMVDGEPQTAICGHTLISMAHGRGAGRTLAQRVLEIPDMAAAYSLNNNALSAPLYKKLGLQAWLGQAGRTRMEWPIRPSIMLAGQILTRLARHDSLYSWLSGRERFMPPTSKPLSLHESQGRTIWLDPYQPDHAALIRGFNAAICKASPAAPVRSAEAYAWQMSDPDAPGRTALLGMVEDGELMGLIQVTVTKPNSFEPAELDVLDLVVHPDSDRTRSIPPLINAARALARQAGLGRVRLPFAGHFDRECFTGTGLRLMRQYGYDPAHAVFHKSESALAREWEPTGFESDMFFALRTVPGSAGPEIGPAAKKQLEWPALEDNPPQA